MKITTITGALALGAAVAACGSVSPHNQAQAQHHAAPAATVSAPPPAPVPSPAGTYTGSCSYTLSDNFNNIVADAGTLTGEVDVTNTGNVGTVVRVRITWPQEGYGPVVMRRTVRVAAGATLPAAFHKIASQNVISNLQNWQQGHNYDDGCTYRATITGTFGAAS